MMGFVYHLLYLPHMQRPEALVSKTVCKLSSQLLWHDGRLLHPDIAAMSGELARANVYWAVYENDNTQFV